MSTTTAYHHDLEHRADEVRKPARRPFWRAIADAMWRSRQRQAEYEIAKYIERHGGRLTDAMEREINSHLLTVNTIPCR
jgi:hypothetical protein